MKKFIVLLAMCAVLLAACCPGIPYGKTIEFSQVANSHPVFNEGSTYTVSYDAALNPVGYQNFTYRWIGYTWRVYNCGQKSFHLVF